MKNINKLIPLIIMTAMFSAIFPMPALAGPYENAVSAYNAKKYETAITLLKPLATAGDAKSQTMLGFMYQSAFGVEQDYIEAAKWYQKAAERGDVQGQTNLGYAYEHGVGIRQSYSEAASWYLKATQRGSGEAAFNLANLYENGLGVKKDTKTAIILYQKLAKAGLKPASVKLNALQQKLSQENSPPTQSKPQPQPQWLVGRWGEVKEDDKGGYKESGGMFGHACSSHQNRGFAELSYVNNQMIAYIIGSTPIANMFDGFDKTPAKYSIVSAKHIKIYPVSWDKDWFEVELLEPGLLSASLHFHGREDEKILLSLCK